MNVGYIEREAESKDIDRRRRICWRTRADRHGVYPAIARIDQEAVGLLCVLLMITHGGLKSQGEIITIN